MKATKSGAGSGGATCSVSASATGPAGTKTGTAEVALQPWTTGELQNVLTFDDTGYTYTNDYTVLTYAAEGATFTCTQPYQAECISPARLYVEPLRPNGNSGENVLYAGTTYKCRRGCVENHDGAADMRIAFDPPRSVESFDVVGKLSVTYCTAAGDGLYHAGTMTLHLEGGDTVTVELNPHGELLHQFKTGCCVPWDEPPYNDDVGFIDTVSLTQYGRLTEIDLHPNRIAFHNYAESSEGMWWCEHWDGGQEFCIDNLKFAELKASRLDLTVIDTADVDQLNQTTAIDATRQLYVAADANGNATVKVTPDSRLATPAGDIYPWPYTHLCITPLGGGTPLFNGTYDQFHSDTNGTDRVVLQGSPTVHDFAIIAWLDEHHNDVYDPGEPLVEVDVHIGDASIRTDHDGDGDVDSTDDGLNLLEPTPINFEGYGPRTEIELDAGFNVAAPSYEAVLRNIAGMEFWDAATGGNRLLPQSNGYLIDDSLGSPGEADRTLWVSGNPGSPDTADPETGEPIAIPIQFAIARGGGAPKAVAAAQPQRVKVLPSRGYLINRDLEALAGSKDREVARDGFNVLTHTFIYTTDAKGNMFSVFSWGDSYKDAAGSHWFIQNKPWDPFTNDPEPATNADYRIALGDALGGKNGQAMKGVVIGGCNDVDIEYAFEVLRTNRDGGSFHPWLACLTCKEEAAKLMALARIAHANKDDLVALNKYVHDNVWVIGAYFPRASEVAKDFEKKLKDAIAGDRKALDAWVKEINAKIKQGSIEVAEDAKQLFQYVVDHLP